ncbi:MAG: TatD family hydrolase [Candidatus Gracilibacteria bacterium]
MLFDTHCHTYLSKEKSEIDILNEIKENNNLYITNIGVDLETSQHCLDIASKYDFAYATVGIHPCDVLKYPNLEKTINKLEILSKNKKVVAIGECGLDYYRLEKETDTVSTPLIKGARGFSYIPYNKELKEKSRELRKNITNAEKKIRYNFLNSIGINITKQKPLLNYIVDFYIPSLGLIIEIDGDSHFQENYIDYENKRTQDLEGYGLEIIRFTNNEIYENFENVCEKIKKKIEQKTIQKTPYPPLSRGQELEQKKQLQKEFFITQINLAKKLDLPLVIHNRKAGNDVFEILQKTDFKNFIMHCYSENLEYAQKLLDFAPDCMISFSGILTFNNAKNVQETASKIPLRNILIETDSPYLAPAPFRGQENYPYLVEKIFEKLCSLRSESKEEIEKVVWENSLRVFGIKV